MVTTNIEINDKQTKLFELLYSGFKNKADHLREMIVTELESDDPDLEKVAKLNIKADTIDLLIRDIKVMGQLS